MKYKILLSLLVVSVLACSVADAEDKLPEVLKNLPEGWQSGTPFDMDAFEKAAEKIRNKREIKKIMGRKPDRIGTRENWYFKGKFVDEITERLWNKLWVQFNGSGEVNFAKFMWEKSSKK